MLWVPQVGPTWSILASSNPANPATNDSVNWTIPANDTYSAWTGLITTPLPRPAYGFTLRSALTYIDTVNYRCLIDIGRRS